MSDRATTRARFLALAALLLTWISGCGSDTPPLPYIRVTSLPATSRVTTNNGRNQAITIQGTIANMPPNRPASIQIVNDLGGFPSAAPAQQLPLGTGGVFSYQIQAPLINPMSPFLPGPDGNVVIIRAANDYSVYDTTGNPIPTTAAFTLIIDNQVVFNHPVYADLDMSDPPNVISECDFSTTDVVSGTFSVPLGTADANDVITSALLVERTDANAFTDPTVDTLDENSQAITINTDGTFEFTVDPGDWNCTPGDGTDCNFFVRFTTNSATARALLGSFDSEVTMATYPFQSCLTPIP